MSISKEKLIQVESVIGRLQYSVYPSEIIEWLGNFKKEEIPDALSFLRNFEYISSDELLYRLDHLLKELFSKKSKTTRFTFVPYGKYGKSSTLVSYPLSHLERFKKRKNYIEFEQDLNRFLKSKKNTDYIVFFDDFIGSGNTFLKNYRKVDELIRSKQYENKIYLIAPITMEEAYTKIKDEFPYIKIITEKRVKYLSSDLSPIKIKKNKKKLSKFILDYGDKIQVGSHYNPYLPKGYDNTESMISFFYGTPNNTFPLIWGDKDWHPLYPRNTNSRLKKHVIKKKDIKYLLNTFLDSNLNVLDANSYISDDMDSRMQRNRERHKNNYLLFALLYLLYQSKYNKELSNFFICNYLGITRENLRIVYVEGKNKGYIACKNELTEKSKLIMRHLNKKRKAISIRKSSEENLSIDNLVFLPKTFRGNS